MKNNLFVNHETENNFYHLYTHNEDVVIITVNKKTGNISIFIEIHSLDSNAHHIAKLITDEKYIDAIEFIKSQSISPNINPTLRLKLSKYIDYNRTTGFISTNSKTIANAFGISHNKVIHDIINLELPK